MTDTWDVVVVGGGPAGACAALAALRVRPSARVLVLDQHEFPRDKSCGDGIAPQAVDVLDSLGMAGLFADQVPVHRLRLGYPDGPHVSGRMRRPALVVPRTVFDDRLVRAAVAAGAVLRRHRVRALARRPDGVEVDGQLLARVLVGADGAGSVVRRAFAAPVDDEGHVALAIRGYAPVRPDLATEQRITFGRGDWPAYAWSFPVGDGRANVGFGEVVRACRPLTRAHLLGRLDELLPGVTDGARDWKAYHLPLSTRRPRPPQGPVLLAGDAAALVNPMTGEGIYYAVLSGACAGAAAVLPGDPARTSTRLLRRRIGTHLRHTAVAATVARHPRVVAAGLRAAQSDPAVFDSLVELGLGRGRLTSRTLGRLALSLR